MEIILASVESSLNYLPEGTTISKLSFPTYSSLCVSVGPVPSARAAVCGCDALPTVQGGP